VSESAAPSRPKDEGDTVASEAAHASSGAAIQTRGSEPVLWATAISFIRSIDGSTGRRRRCRLVVVALNQVHRWCSRGRHRQLHSRPGGVDEQQPHRSVDINVHSVRIQLSREPCGRCYTCSFSIKVKLVRCLLIKHARASALDHPSPANLSVRKQGGRKRIGVGHRAASTMHVLFLSHSLKSKEHCSRRPATSRMSSTDPHAGGHRLLGTIKLLKRSTSASMQ
jgi:hypothetical protein